MVIKPLLPYNLEGNRNDRQGFEKTDTGGPAGDAAGTEQRAGGNPRTA